MLRVFVGYDRRETVAFHVCAFSIIRRASVPVSITGLMLPQLPLTRPRDPKQSTDFAFSRFLVPYLCGFEGRAVFMDCDMLCRTDIAQLFAQADSSAVSVVKHDYTPRDSVKFLGQQQTAYPRKNWSSLMLFNNRMCGALQPDYVNSASGLELHRFEWLIQSQIGELDPTWNHLVGEMPHNPAAKIVHYTNGGPWFADYEDCEFADEWRAERDAMLDPA